jgi:hypothetical protein
MKNENEDAYIIYTPTLNDAHEKMCAHQEDDVEHWGGEDISSTSISYFSRGEEKEVSKKS